jgi:hypothetical protein
VVDSALDEMHTVQIRPPWAKIKLSVTIDLDSLCGLVVRVPGYRSRGPGSILGATKCSEKWVWNRVHSASLVRLRSYLKEKVAAAV